MAAAKRIEAGRRVRFAVVGAGWISQAAFLPAVAGTANSELVGLVTGDPEKGRALAERYRLPHVWSYKEYGDMLACPEIDAVYLALPNGLHRDFAVPALEAGLHLLLEKPMAVSEQECRDIEAAATGSGARLMIAYRLHFEPATLEAIRLVRAGAIGDPRLFSSSFSQHVSPTNHRAQQGFWAGPVADMGPYPINAARNLFGAEPTELWAVGAMNPDLPFEFDDTVSVTMRFPGQRLAQFTVSYGAESAGAWRLLGTAGNLRLEPGYGFGTPMRLAVTQGSDTREQSFPETDQFGGELGYFSDCVIAGRDPEPDGEEGRLDVRVVAAIERALATGRPQVLEPVARSRRPDPAQAAALAPSATPPLVHAGAPGEDVPPAA
ncbi:Gfo/Idh/MocA family oxidoreductase [Enterovirga sp.]|uniref:Gfo/Idh/MocA family protein n=1 Tax=Enterovirga sp. TaxID=2026350 RepID=UPI0026035E4D|nr:Gfo/Idh/MocA family oxidoreductase [Enterovirga sp.]MDB5592508.1 glucose-fructose oxidoreductase [Enterovirga sp.]